MHLPDKIPSLFAEYWNSNDATNLSNLFTEDTEFVNVVGLWWHNKANRHLSLDLDISYFITGKFLEESGGVGNILHVAPTVSYIF